MFDNSSFKYLNNWIYFNSSQKISFFSSSFLPCFTFSIQPCTIYTTSFSSKHIKSNADARVNLFNYRFGKATMPTFINICNRNGIVSQIKMCVLFNKITCSHISPGRIDNTGLHPWMTHITGCCNIINRFFWLVSFSRVGWYFTCFNVRIIYIKFLILR